MLGVVFSSQNGSVTVDEQGNDVQIPISRTEDHILLAYEEGSGKYVLGIIWDKDTTTYGTTILISNNALTLSGSSADLIWVKFGTPNAKLKYFDISF